MRTRFVTHIVGLFLFLSVVIGSVAYVGLGNDAAFDSGAWLNGDARTRGRMAEDLVAQKVLIGLSAEDVERQLGHPKKNYGKVIEYHVDLGWPFKNPIHYGLQVHFDADRKVNLVNRRLTQKKAPPDGTVPFSLP